MNTEKIKILRETSRKLMSEELYYDWENSGHCNCGVVAQVALGISSDAVLDKAQDAPQREQEDGGPWTKRAAFAINCSKTGLPVAEIFSMLVEKGFTLEEIYELEHMTDERILDKMYAKDQDILYHSKESLINYLNNWVEVLQEEEQVEAMQIGTEVHQSITNNLKETPKDNSKKELLNG